MTEESILDPPLYKLSYRKEIEKLFIDFIKLTSNHSKDYSDELTLDIYTAINHERQHQELMIYDFQYYYNRFLDDSDNYVPKKSNPHTVREHVPKEMIRVDGGLFSLGYTGEEFCYDNELPENKILHHYSLARINRHQYGSFLLEHVP